METDWILKRIIKKIKHIESKDKDKFIIDKIDVIALKELYNDISENPPTNAERETKNHYR